MIQCLWIQCQCGGHGFNPWFGKIPRLSMILTRAQQKNQHYSILGRGAVATGSLYTVSAVLLAAAVTIIKAVQGQPVDKAACIFPRFSPLYVLKGAGKMNSKENLLRALQRTKNIKPLHPETSQCMETNV